MGLFNNGQRSRGVLQLLVIQFFCWLAWSVSCCLAQFDISEGVTGSVNFPALGITCAGNLAAFVTSLIRGRLNLEMGARDVLTLLCSKLTSMNEINGNGLTTCGDWDYLSDAYVVMLSNGTPNSSILDFMKCNANFLDSILLQFLPLRHAVVSVETCECNCKCIVFWTVGKVTVMLAHRMPGTLKQVSDFLCLLPCLTCLRNGCHGANNGLLHVEIDDSGMERLTEGDSIMKSPVEPHVVCKFLEDNGAPSINVGERICICIPTHGAGHDVWTKLLIRSLRSRDAESRGIVVLASQALEGYLAGNREVTEGSVEFKIASFIVPRLTEVLINLVLTVWFIVDGFSSSLIARRTIKDYIVDSKGSGFAANVFLTKAVVKSDANSTCQLLIFRGNLLNFRTVSFTVGCVNMVSSIFWAVLISFDNGDDSSPPPSMARVAVIMAAIGIALGMDLVMVLAAMSRDTVMTRRLYLGYLWHYFPQSFLLMFLEMMCFLAGSLVAGILGIKLFGKWIYGAVQILVWLKWGLGSAFHVDDIPGEIFETNISTSTSLRYSSAFLLNGVLAGVRSTWGPWLWKNNHLWSRKLLH